MSKRRRETNVPIVTTVKKSKSLSKSVKQPQREEEDDDSIEEELTFSTKEALMKATGLSELMLVVALDLLEKGPTGGSSSITGSLTTTTTSNAPPLLLDVVCMNPAIRVLNHDMIELYRPEYAAKKQLKTCDVPVKKEEEDDDDDAAAAAVDPEDNLVESLTSARSSGKKSKVYTDEEIRKYIVELHEKELLNRRVRLAGTQNQVEKMSALERDRAMVSEFTGYATTNHRYIVYVYYVGPVARSASDLSNVKNWLPVHKNHLMHFHRHLRQEIKSHYTHTAYDQLSFVDDPLENPSYDARYIAHKWLLSKEGKAWKPILVRHRHLFSSHDQPPQPQEDFFVKQCATKAPPLYYFDVTKEDILRVEKKATTPVIQQQPPRLNVIEDRKKQQACGYRLSGDEKFSHVNITEYPEHSRLPLPQEIDLSFEEYQHLARHVHIEGKMQAPERWDPFVAVKAVMMALNPTMVIRRTPPLIADQQVQILEADDVEPFLRHLSNNKEANNQVKEATSHLLWALMSTEILTREPPNHIQERLEANPFALLEA